MSEDNGSVEEKTACKDVKSAIQNAGFADYFFVGVSLSGRRFSAYSIGNDGHEHGFSNCERWDRLVGAMTRQIIKWEIENGKDDLDLE